MNTLKASFGYITIAIAVAFTSAVFLWQPYWHHLLPKNDWYNFNAAWLPIVWLVVGYMASRIGFSMVTKSSMPEGFAGYMGMSAGVIAFAGALFAPYYVLPSEIMGIWKTTGDYLLLKQWAFSLLWLLCWGAIARLPDQFMKDNDIYHVNCDQHASPHTEEEEIYYEALAATGEASSLISGSYISTSVDFLQGLDN